MPANPPSQPEAVEALIAEIRHAARAYRAHPSSGLPARADTSAEDAAGIIDGYLAELWRRSQPRTELPHRFRRFPLTLGPVRKLALRLYNLLTKEQRASTSLMCEALKAVQSALVQKQDAASENAVLIDYVRAQLKRGAYAQAVTSRATNPLPHDSQLDNFFVALGDRFRGTPQLITDRLKVYLPMVRDAGMRGPALDLGCGRGEWLELMRDAGVQAMGIEHNSVLFDVCTRKGLEVVEGDISAFLQQSPSEHWQLVTAFQVIEHLGWPAWFGFMRDIHRVLLPGGMAIVETPNPANVVTAANRFHLDPAHRHPLPHALLEFTAKQVGFGTVEILPLHAEGETATRLHAAGVPREIADSLFGSQDYALIARR
jgi:predicted TPR repeat methyltransferase